MNLLSHVLYINLEYRKDRLKHIKSEFKKLEINPDCYERFPAIKTASGAIGCTLSHIRCIELAKERGYPHVFICEDDITFTNTPLFKENLAKFAKSNFHWDVIVVAGNNCPPFEQCTLPDGATADFCVKIMNCQTTTGYIVDQHYYDILLQNFKEGLEKLIRNPWNKPKFAIDMYWKQLQNRDQWYLITPLTVTQRPDYSDIENQYLDFSKMLLDLDKTELFKKRREFIQMHFRS